MTQPETPCVPPNGEPTACDDHLPNTGADLALWAVVALFAVFLGVYFVLTSGRNRRDRRGGFVDRARGDMSDADRSW